MAKAVYEDDPSDESQIAPVKRSNKPVYEDDEAESGMPTYQGRMANRLADIQSEYGNAPAQDLEGRRISMAVGPAAKKPVARPTTPVAAPETPAGNPKLNSLRETKPRNFDPSVRSSESVANSMRDTLDKQLKKAPTENMGRMAARQALEKKAADTAKSQAIIDRLSRRTRPYIKDEAGGDMKRGGAVKKMASGGSVSSASSRGDGIAQRGKTRGKLC
jgi:hypothetical protein